MQEEEPMAIDAMTPAVKGNATPTNSLSTVISFLIFAKVDIIFVTLHRYIRNKSKNYIK